MLEAATGRQTISAKRNSDFCRRFATWAIYRIRSKLPATPMGQMCLDGTFYRENGRNYMIYCHEWIDVSDGTVEMLELDADMNAVSAPVRLFCGSAPVWSSG